MKQKEIVTKDLILLLAENGRDNEAFLDLLREGDFKHFCGVDFSEENLECFNNYFEGKEDYHFAVFPQSKPSQFIGYVGLGKRINGYEAEFYIGRRYRQNGYARQALSKICELAFAGKLSNLYDKVFAESKISATTLEDNMAARDVLLKSGFTQRDDIACAWNLSITPEGEVISNKIVEFFLEKQS